MSRCTVALLSLAVAFILVGAVPAHAQCDANYVSRRAKVIAVAPTGADDTANLQCAFDWAARIGPGVSVHLAEGTFTTAQLIVDNLRGVIRGMGQERTVIRSLSTPLPIDNPDCSGTGSCFALAPPSPTNRYPVLVSVLGEDVTISDLSFEIVSSPSTVAWTNEWGYQIEMLSAIVGMRGSHASLLLDRVTLSAGTYTWGADNRIVGQSAGTMGIGTFNQPWFVTGSTLAVTASILRGGDGIGILNLDGCRVTFTGNRFELATFTGILVGDLHNSDVAFTHNELVAPTPGLLSVFMFAGNVGTGISGSSFNFAHNAFAGDNAVWIEPGTFDRVKCQAVNNDIRAVPGEPYALNGNPCKVVGAGTNR